MVKFVLALVLLLHLCYSHPLNKPLKMEILNGFKILTNLHREKKVNITDQRMMLVPSEEMRANAASCLGVWVRELKNLLDYNITVHEDDMHVLKQLQQNLVTLGPQQENDQKCKMTKRLRRGNSLTPFSPYVTFLRKYRTL